MPKHPDFSDLKKYRRSLGMTQTGFWSRYGVTQSAGSRYESGDALHAPLRMLIWLRESRRLTDEDLAKAMKVVKKK